MFTLPGLPRHRLGTSHALAQLSLPLLLYRSFPVLYLLAAALSGGVAGWTATLLLEIFLTAPVGFAPPPPAGRDPAGEDRPLAAHQIILDRNIFNAKGPAAGRLDGGSPAGAAPQAPAAVPRPSGAAASRGDLTLIGTMVAGSESLAVVRQGGETRIFRQGDPVGDDVAVGEIARNTVILEGRDGSRHTLSLPAAGGGVEPGEERGGPPSVYEIEQTGATKWTISRQSAEVARAHVSELLNQARMEPRIIGDQVSGFLVRRIQPGSFLQQLGLRRGDVIMGVNGVAFNSPEQLLQILQQLREARSIRVDLRRDDQPLTFEYETR